MNKTNLNKLNSDLYRFTIALGTIILALILLTWMSDLSMMMKLIATVFEVGGLAILYGFNHYLSNNVLQPLTQLHTTLNNVAEGDFTSKVDYAQSEAFTELFVLVERIVDDSKILAVDMTQLLNQITAGNVDVKTNYEYMYINDFAPILHSMKDIAKKFNTVSSNVGGTIRVIDENSDKISLFFEQLQNDSISQQDTISDFMTVIKELQGMTKQGFNTIHELSNGVVKIEESATSGGLIINKAIEAMNTIDTYSKDILGIIQDIENIAQQTNLLALNASIEAARAGESGKGFAVVAGEIRELAGKSSETVRGIEEIIKKSFDSIQHGKSVIGETESAFSDISDKIKDANGAFAEMVEYVEGQSEHLSIIPTKILAVSKIIEDTVVSSNQNTVISQELHSQIQVLKSAL